MGWDGIERRSNQRFCDGHIDLCEATARIEERLIAIDKRIADGANKIEKHIDHSRPRNIAIATSLITIIIFLLKFSYSLGESSKQVGINTVRLEKIENIYYRIMQENKYK